MKKLITFLTLSALAVSNIVSAGGAAGTKPTSHTIEHSDSKPNKQLLNRAKIILDKALAQITGNSDRSLRCTEIDSGISKDEMARFVKRQNGHIIYVRSKNDPEYNQNSVLIGYEVKGGEKKDPLVILISVYFEKESCAALGLRVAYDEPHNRQP